MTDHEARARAAQPQHGGGDLLRPTKPPDRQVSVKVFSGDSFTAAFTGTLRLSMILPIAIALLVILLMNGKGKRGSHGELAENSFRIGTAG